jgi:hypothetical protein
MFGLAHFMHSLFKFGDVCVITSDHKVFKGETFSVLPKFLK